VTLRGAYALAETMNLLEAALRRIAGDLDAAGL
jgi:hypothetical protein